MRSAFPVFAVALASCVNDVPEAAPRVYPTVEELPEVAELPPLLESFFGDAVVDDAGDWGWRRAEMLDVMTHYAYGPAPDLAITATTEVARGARIDGLDVDYVEHRGDLSDGTAIFVGVFAPAGAARVPAVLGPNRCGNQRLAADERLRVSTSLDADCDGSRGPDLDNWPLAQIAAAGLAVVTFHQSDLSHDDEFLGRDNTLSAWAKGNSLALDVLERVDTAVDVDRVGVFGHSRRGKVALLTAARDPRVAAVVAHQSGTLGQSVLRNGLGEPLQLITAVFPWWFTGGLPDFVGREARLPFDQHHLVALVAPRPLLLVDGDEDDWADPAGAVEAARAASPAWELLGADGLVDVDGAPGSTGTLAYHLRPGDHDTYEADWSIFLPFLAEHLR